jgi:micrococcal nuclease
MSHAGPRFQPRRRPRPASLAVVAMVALLLVVRACVEGDTEPSTPPLESLAAGEYLLERVVDGDTLLLRNGARVRLLGVDTPETVKPDTPPEPWGAEASQFTRDFLAGGAVRLEFDRERVDSYGRFLAYAWVGERLLNEELLRAGLARPLLHFNYSSSMKTRFRHAADEAREAGLRIWSHEPPTARRKAA